MSDLARLSSNVLQKTVALLRLLPATCPMPMITIESETAVGLDWDEGANHVVAVTVDDHPRIGFASRVGGNSQYGRLEFTADVPVFPDTLRHMLTRLYGGEP